MSQFLKSVTSIGSKENNKVAEKKIVGKCNKESLNHAEYIRIQQKKKKSCFGKKKREKTR